MHPDCCTLLFLAAFFLGWWIQERLKARRQRALERAHEPSHRQLDSFLAAVREALSSSEGAGRVLDLSYATQLRSGRSARVEFRGTNAATQVRLVVLRTASVQVPTLRVRLEDAVKRMTRGARKENVETGDATFDARFHLRSSDPVGAGRALDAELRRTITQAFSIDGVERLAFEPGVLSLLANPDMLSPERWEDLLQDLDRAVDLFDTRPLSGDQRGLVVGGATRCPFCRDGITGDEPDLVACDRCRTVLHDACWIEHGACPMLGCEGKAPERARRLK